MEQDRLTTEQQRDTNDYLLRKFHKWFSIYCGELAKGVPTRMFIADTQHNRVLAHYFRQYLEQRAESEGWEYDQGNFGVTYIDKKDATRSALLLLNTGHKAQAIGNAGGFLKLARDGERSDVGFSTNEEGIERLLSDRETEETRLKLDKYLEDE